MTLNNNRAPLLCYFKLCASFCSFMWIQTVATVRKRPIWVKIEVFLCRMTLKFDVWPRQNLPLLCLIFCILFCHMLIQTGVMVRKRLNRVWTSVTLTTFDPWPWLLHGYHWKFHDDSMTGTLSKRCDRETGRQTDTEIGRRMEGPNHSQRCWVTAEPHQHSWTANPSISQSLEFRIDGFAVQSVSPISTVRH